MEFLCELRERARVRKARKLGHPFQSGGDRLREWSSDVGVGNRVGLYDRGAPGRRECVPGVRVEFSGRRQPIDRLKSADGVAEVVAIRSVDLARGEMRPIEQRFGLGDKRRILVVRALWGGFIDRSGSHWRRRHSRSGGGETEDETGGADAKHGLTTGFIPDWFHFRLT